jgi:hypothetical protein
MREIRLSGLTRAEDAACRASATPLAPIDLFIRDNSSGCTPTRLEGALRRLAQRGRLSGCDELL